MTRKRVGRIIIFIILAAMVVAWLIFTRPMTLDEIYPGLDWNDLDTLCVRSQQNWLADTGKAHQVHDQYHYDAELTEGDELREELVELLRSQTFRRKLSSFLPHGTRYHTVKDGDFMWELYSNGTGTHFHLSNWYGDLRVYDHHKGAMDYDLKTDKAFGDKIFALITDHIEPNIDYYGE